MTLSQDLRSLNPSSIIELFELNLPTGFKGDTIRFHNGLNELGTNVTWKGNVYNFFPIEASGFEFSGKGQLPRPTLRVANVSGLIGTLVRDYNDMLGAKVTRIRTLLKYLDAVNFPSGTNPTADPNAELPRDYYYVDRKATENKLIIEFELAAKFDVSFVQLPRRQIVQNTCAWVYRGGECGYTGTNYFDTNDNPTNSANDVCGKKLTSCQLRWGNNAELPYGGFPSVGLIR
jgi:lambda family phage minor tail protein L